MNFINGRVYMKELVLIGKNKKNMVIVMFVFELIFIILGFVKLLCVIFCKIVFDKVRVIFVKRVMIICGSWIEKRINLFVKFFLLKRVGNILL